jgi:Ferritin-like domain
MASPIRPPLLSPDDAQRAENVLDDVELAPDTRRALLRRLSAGAASFGVLGLAACGSSNKSSSTAATTAAGTTAATASGASGSADKITTIVNAAITAEALAVTYLSGLLQNNLIPKQFVKVIEAANQTEYDHFKALQSLGAKPLTTKFWAPNAFFDKSKVFATIEVAEGLFVNAYLIAMTEFAKAGKSDEARYAGEILGTEAEHLALARFAQGKLPNDVGFMGYEITTIDGIVKGLGSAGIGFGQKGSKPGKFYEFPGKPPSSTTTKIMSEAVA